MECALSGASKTQVIRTFKNKFNLSEEQINELIEECKFKNKPKIINY